MRIIRPTILGPALVLLLAGCVAGTATEDAASAAETEVSSDTQADSSISDAVDAVTDGALDAAPDGAPDVAADTGADVVTDAGADVVTDAAADVVTDAAADAGQDGGFVYPTLVFPPCPGTSCKTPGAGAKPKVIVLAAVRWDTNTVTILNHKTTTEDLAGWRLCRWIDHCAQLPTISLPVGSWVRIHLTESGTDTQSDIYLGAPTSGWDLGPIGELAVFDNSALFDGPALESFVRWGAAPLSGEPSYAALAFDTLVASSGNDVFWEQDGYAEVCATADGMICNGNPVLAQGYHAQPKTCPAWTP